jgi:ADP-dependent NAD(P)H-hydrate dehydratase / NAD(P)H-hydrate epimerase
MPLVLSAAQSRALDRELVERTGLPSVLLMENAGRGIAEELLRRFPPGARPTQRVAGQTLRVTIVCGPGNNGGDGFAVARQLVVLAAAAPGQTTPRWAALSVDVLLATPPASALGSDAATMFRALPALAEQGVVVHDHSGVTDLDTWRAALADCDVVVDALFGTGLRTAITGVPAVAVAAMNEAGAAGVPIVAIDMPSGLNADSGKATGIAVAASVTMATGCYKLGLLLDASATVGEIAVVSLGGPIRLAPEHGPFVYALGDRLARSLLPVRAASVYKGSSGHLVVIAGSAGKTGAALLVGRAAMRAGAGLVTIATTAAGRAALDAKVVEVMTAAYSTSEDAEPASAEIVAALLAAPSVRALAVGPGIPTGPEMRSMVRMLATSANLPVVLDADALNALGTDGASLLAAAPAARIVTPHPGEMARLIGRRTAEVEADRLGVARSFSHQSGAIVVLKGAHTVIATPDGTAFISPLAEPALATAGSGDVLTGVIASFIAQGLSPLAAAQAGVWIHLRAGAVAAQGHGACGVIAGDLPDAVAIVRSTWS